MHKIKFIYYICNVLSTHSWTGVYNLVHSPKLIEDKQRLINLKGDLYIRFYFGTIIVSLTMETIQSTEV